MKIEFLIIKDENESCNSLKTFNSFLNSNADLRVTKKLINYKKFEVNFKLKTDLINNLEKKERYFLLTIERMSLTKLIDSKSNNQIKINSELNKLIDLKRVLMKMIIDSKIGFIVTILWDDTSYYFSKISYPYINEIENLLRKLIYKFMLINIGKNWLSITLPKELEKVTKRNITGDKEEKMLREELLKFDFIDLITFLFNNYNSSNLDEIHKKIEKAKRINDLDLKIVKEVIPKSNWDKYFSKYIDIDKLDEKWKKLYELRNKVAHNKIIDRGDYEEIVNLSNEIKKALLIAINKLDEIAINEEQKKEISISNIFTNIDKITTALSNPIFHNLNINDLISENIIKYAKAGEGIAKAIDTMKLRWDILNYIKNDNTSDNKSDNENEL